MTSRVQKLLIALSVPLLIGLAMVGLLAGAAAYGWRAAQQAGNEAATIQNLKTIAAVETQYFNTHKRTFASFEQLVSEQMLSSKFAGHPPKVDGYVLSLTLTSNSAAYTINADPLSPRAGTPHFYLDSASGQIRVSMEGPAGPSDPPWEK